MSRSLSVLLSAAVLAVGLGGCGAGPAGSPTATAAPGSAKEQASPCRSPATTSATTVTLTEADNGSTICLAVGEQLEVYLHGTLSAKWTPISLEGKAMSVTVSGKGTLPVGVTGGFFVAKAAGDARLTSTRPTCTTSSPTSASCAEDRFAVDIQIR